MRPVLVIYPIEMAYTKNIEKKIKEFDYNCWNLAEALLNCEEEMQKKIDDLTEEIRIHECS